MTPPEAITDPQTLNSVFDLIWKLVAGLGGGAVAGIIFLVGLKSSQKIHEDRLDNHDERLKELEGRHNQTEIKMATLPTRDDLVLMQQTIQAQIRDSFTQITSLLTRGHSPFS